MTSLISEKEDNLTCRVCQYRGSDVRLVGCGCTVHARCVPRSLVLNGEKTPKSLSCPICQSGVVTGLYLFPLCFQDLEQSIELRKACAIAESIKAPAKDKERRPTEYDVHDEASYRVYSQGRSSSLVSTLKESDSHRTGRWTDEEVAYVDHLVVAFDQGKLPIPNGVKLNRFLGDILLCKSSRLTKKMKNAKLSTRSFERRSLSYTTMETAELSLLQDKLLTGLCSETSKLELYFNIKKQWRSYFSNLCLQLGYTSLNITDFLASLEELERRAAASEEKVKKIRRRSMGLSGRRPNGGNPSSMAGDNGSRKAPRRLSHPQPSVTPSSHSTSNLKNDEIVPPAAKRPRTFSEDFGDVLKDLIEADPAKVEESSLISSSSDGAESHTASLQTSSNALSPPFTSNIPPSDFLEAISRCLESHNFPFQTADVWVPSATTRSTASPTDVQLLHAGSSLRRDLSQTLASTLRSFGDYSKSFTFQPGHGLPGRVYGTGRALWEFKVNGLEASFFARSEGARAYGIKTAVGIPLATQGGVGRMVVMLYSTDHVMESNAMIDQITSDLSGYLPEPKWKLVIEIGPNAKLPPRPPAMRRNSSTVTAATSNTARGNNRTGGPADSSSNQSEHHSPFSSAMSPALSAQGLPYDLDSSHGLSPLFTNSNSNNNQNKRASGSMSPLTLEKKMDRTEQELIDLLGKSMPAMAAGESTSSAGGSNGHLFNEFIAMRLLLLRPSSKRNQAENELVEILKSSYKAYSSGNRRSGIDLATLLAKDWNCLKGSLPPSNAPGPAPSPQIQPSSASHGNNQGPAQNIGSTNFQPASLGPRRASMPTMPPTIPLPPPSQKLAHCHSVPNLGALNVIAESMSSGEKNTSPSARKVSIGNTPSNVGAAAAAAAAAPWKPPMTVHSAPAAQASPQV